MKLLYLANARIPTEKAHGLQIMQNCEALADNGAAVTLWAARRVNTDAMNEIEDPWAHYGVKHNFDLWRVPCLDLQWLVGDDIAILRRGAFFLQIISYSFLMCLSLLFTRSDIYYSRDLLTVWLLTFLKPRHKVAYEPHRLSNSGIGRWLQTMAVRRAGTIFPITATMAAILIERGADPTQVHTAHDGIRKARFEHVPDQKTARREIGWPDEAFIVGYVGRLHTMSMDKGVSTLIQAIAQLEGVSLGLVGGPEDMAEKLRRQWLASGLPEERFLYAGQVKPEAVPHYLSAFDVCAMPHPYTDHYATATSPLKLFEYMASQRPIVASDLPGWADVVVNGHSALLVPPGDANALAKAIKLLLDNPEMRVKLATNAYARVMVDYTWDSRAKRNLDCLNER